MRDALLRIFGVKTRNEVTAEVLQEPHVREAQRLLKGAPKSKLELELRAIERRR